MTSTLFQAHSGLRYLVLLAALVAVGTLALALCPGTGLRPSQSHRGLDLRRSARSPGARRLRPLDAIPVVSRPDGTRGDDARRRDRGTCLQRGEPAARRGPAEQRPRAGRCRGFPLVLIIGGILAIGRPIVGRSSPPSPARRSLIVGHFAGSGAAVNITTETIVRDYRVAVRSRQVEPARARARCSPARPSSASSATARRSRSSRMAQAFRPGDIRSGYYRDQTLHAGARRC